MFYSVIPPPPPRYTLPVAYAAGTVNGMPVPVLETVNVVKHPEGGCDLQVPEDTYRDLLRSIWNGIRRKKTVSLTITSPAASTILSTTPELPPDQPVNNAQSDMSPISHSVPTVTLHDGEKIAMRKAVLAKKKKLRKRNGGGRIVQVDADTIAHGALTPSNERLPGEGTNPLATAPTPPTCGVKITPVFFEDSAKEPRYFPARINGTVKYPNVDTRRGRCGSQELPPVYGDSNPAMYNNDREKEKERDKNLDPIAMGQKRRKPKSNIVKSGSSFISRVLNHEGTAKRLLERDPYNMYLFANINRAFHWLDVANKNKQDPLSKILFTKAHIICHAVNECTKSPTHLDVLMGSNLGDILWYEPVSQKYSHINKNGIIVKSSVNDIKWIPGSENLFIAAMGDGSLVVYDKEREDAPFVSEEVELDGVLSNLGRAPRGMNMGMGDLDGAMDSLNICESNPGGEVAAAAVRSPGMVEFAPGTVMQQGEGTDPNDAALFRSTLRILKSVESSHQTKNPVAIYKLSHLSVTQLSFSPDNRHLAAVLEDCTLRIIDFLAEEQLDIFHAYYGGINCVAWSPDGKYLVTGGQDDLVTIWSFKEKRIVARCQGHTSFVRSVAFDPWRLNHPVEKRSATAQLPPILSKKVADDPLFSIIFFEDGIVTSSLEGHIRTWDRPSTESDTKSHSPSQSISRTQSQSQPYIRYPPFDISSYPSSVPPQRESTAMSVGMSDGGSGGNGGGAGSYSGHSWNANGINTNVWVDANGWKSRENRYGSNSTGQSSFHSSQISPSQTLHEGAKP
ncbi:hypothetical protein KEM54_006837 [Ascosphaera aggregata]|nr:hypothetical protein KEM54_006837 [Ascosphaera aggregata]